MRTDRSDAHVRRTAARGLARIAALAAVACACGGPFIPAVNAGSTQTGPALGLWYDDTGDGAVEVRPCGDKLCGYIVWLKEPVSTKTGQPKVDAYNPEPSKRARSICGLQVLGNLERQCSTAAGITAGCMTPKRANPTTPPLPLKDAPSS